MNIRRGDVIAVDLGNRFGCEIDGIRPALVIQNDIGNEYSPTTIIAPFTAKKAKELELPVHVKGVSLKKESILLLEQITTIDKKKILGILNHLGEETMKEVDEKIKASLAVWYVFKQWQNIS